MNFHKNEGHFRKLVITNLFKISRGLSHIQIVIMPKGRDTLFTKESDSCIFVCTAASKYHLNMEIAGKFELSADETVTTIKMDWSTKAFREDCSQNVGRLVILFRTQIVKNWRIKQRRFISQMSIFHELRGGAYPSVL